MTEFVDPYVDVEHGCLRNLWEITDAHELAVEEAAIVAVRLHQSADGDSLPTTVENWRAVHRHLFGDVYSWAGEFRTVNITKDAHTFHPVSHLHVAADYCATQMRQIARLDRPGLDALAEQLSVLLSDMNDASVPRRQWAHPTLRHRSACSAPRSPDRLAGDRPGPEP